MGALLSSFQRVLCSLCCLLEASEENTYGSSDMKSPCISSDSSLSSHLKPIRVQQNRRLYVTMLAKSNPVEKEVFPTLGDGFQYQILEVIGKGSYGVVCSAIDVCSGERVAIKKIHDVFEHVSDATRILREIKLLRLLRHPNIVEIKHIILPPSSREFKDLYVVFELMESDLHQVVRTNNDLTPEHHQIFLYQLLRAMKFIHSANVFHRDLKPRNILANSDCTLKICDFGLARAAFDSSASAVFWTDYVATRWYRAPELCGCFFSKYTPAIDIWSVGCIFGEILTGKPLFPGKTVTHQLDLITNLLGTPPPEAISRVRNEKARKYLSIMRKKSGAPFSLKFAGVDPLAAELLKKLLSFDSKDRPSAEEALAHKYFKGLRKIDEPALRPISKLEFDFERHRLTKDNMKELIYEEILEYHPQTVRDYLRGVKQTNFMFPSAVDRFRRQFADLEQCNGRQLRKPLTREHASLPRERVTELSNDTKNPGGDVKKPSIVSSASFSPSRSPSTGLQEIF